MYSNYEEKMLDEAFEKEVKSNEIIEVIERFVHQIDPEIEVIDADEFAADIKEKVIFVNTHEFFDHTELMEVHAQVLKELGYKLDILIPTHAILHEVGHIIAGAEYENLDLMSFLNDLAVEGIAEMDAGLIEKLKEYKALPMERDADEFAYDYYIANKEKVKNLENEILTIVG